MSSKTKTTATKEDDKPLLVPKLRFLEFRDANEWEQTTLGAVARLRNGYAFKSSEYVDSGPFQIITIANVQQGTLSIDATKRIAELPSDIQPHQKLSIGDILVSMTGNVGRVCRVTSDALLQNQRVGKLMPEEIIPDFFYHILQRDEFRNTMQLKAAGGAQGNLSSGDITEYAFHFPADEPEQQKIAECLSSADELIAAQARKLDALKTHKKGLMQQLFPSECETPPRIRFPEFLRAAPWKLRKIGSMLVENQRPIELSDEAKYRLVTVKRRYGGLVLRGIMKGREIKVKSQFTVEVGDFLISKRQIVHNACGLVPDELDGSVVSNEYSVLTPKPECSIEFFSWFAMQPSVSASFMNCSVGIVIEKMLFKLPAWLKQEFLFPSLPEQQRIADCLTSINDLIAAQTQKLDALKTHKKGLMQQLFPTPEEIEA